MLVPSPLAASGSLPPGAPQGPGSRVPALRPEHGLVDFTRSAVAMARMVKFSSDDFDQWAFAISRRRRVPHGKTDMPNG